MVRDRHKQFSGHSSGNAAHDDRPAARKLLILPSMKGDISYWARKQQVVGRGTTREASLRFGLFVLLGCVLAVGRVYSESNPLVQGLAGGAAGLCAVLALMAVVGRPPGGLRRK